MKTLLILAHPDIESSRVNKGLIDSLPSDNRVVTVHQLYKDYPNRVFDVKAERKLMEKHDRIIFQFPLQWFSSPYLLTKWFDEVFGHGWCYGPSGDKLQNKEIGLVVTTGGPKVSYRAGGYNEYTLGELLRPFQATANLVGAKYLPIFGFYSAGVCSDEDIDAAVPKYHSYLVDASDEIKENVIL